MSFDPSEEGKAEEQVTGRAIIQIAEDGENSIGELIRLLINQVRRLMI